MTAKVITFGIQKGGSGKTTSAGMTAYVLSHEHKVLAVDMDSQGNLTELVTGRVLDQFRGLTSMEAIQNGDMRPYMVRVTENLNVVPADNFLALFPKWVYQDYRGSLPYQALLRKALEPVMEEFDYIIIDTPPSLGVDTMNALAASDWVVAMFEPSKYCLNALENFLGSVETVRGALNPDLRVAGILRTIIDSRRSDSKVLLEVVVEQYGEYAPIFESVITRTAHTGRLNIEGFVENPELRKAVQDYTPFIEELMAVVK